MNKQVYNSKCSNNFFKDNLVEIEKVAIRTGQVKEIYKFLGISKATLKKYRKKNPELDDLINNALGKYRPFTPLQLKHIEKIKGRKYKKDIAKFLGVSIGVLLSYKKKYRELDRIIEEAVIDKRIITCCPYTQEQLKEVEKIMSTGLKQDVWKFLNISESTGRAHQKRFTELKEAIDNGKDRRAFSHISYERRVLKPDFIMANLVQIEKMATNKGKIKEVASFLGIHEATLRDYRKIDLDLKLAIQRGIERYKANKLAKVLNSKKATEEQTPIELFQFKKAPKELVAKVDNIESLDEADALARYRRMKQVEKERMSRRELKNIDFVGV